MRIGIGLPNQVPNLRPDVVPAWASLAEEAGFELLTTVGRQAYPGLSDTVALAAAAAVTNRIELVSAVLLATTWPGALLAKELAGIDAISGGRLTLGVAVGQRSDDFIAAGYGTTGRGARFERDLKTYRKVWSGEPVGGGSSPAVPEGTRQIPLMFGGFAPAALDRMARWGDGYIAASLPAPMVAPSLETAREAWQRAGRAGAPRLLALAYFALGDGEKGRANVHDYYHPAPELADIVAAAVCDTPAKVKDTVSAFADLGVDELSFNTATDDPDDVKRLAETVF